ncbi:MAG: DUF1059 domain-containing protein [Spirochaetales bacterium]|nr:DUF1059 domain-containing protein [Spirochaetales bacterium]
MKTMKCKDLGGACEREFHAPTFEEMAEISRNHGIEMLKKQDRPHLEAMNRMREIMEDPQKMQEWINSKRMEFDKLPED